jgi:hypothetical protein
MGMSLEFKLAVMGTCLLGILSLLAVWAIEELAKDDKPKRQRREGEITPLQGAFFVVAAIFVVISTLAGLKLPPPPGDRRG